MLPFRAVPHGPGFSAGDDDLSAGKIVGSVLIAAGILGLVPKAR